MQAIATGATVEQRERELEILTAVTTALNSSATLTEALETALAQVAELLQLRTGWVWLFDDRSDAPFLAASQNLPAALRDHPERMQGRCFCLNALRRGELDAAANVVTCSRLDGLTDGTGGLRVHASVPLHARGARVGVLNVASAEWRELAPDELRLLHLVGEMLGLGIERSRLYEQSAAAGAAEERNRIAREIHDTLAQGIAATALQLETADALLEAGAEPERVRAAVRQALESTRQNLEDARRSVLDLRPRPLQDRSLARALRALCADRGEAGTPEVAFELQGGDRPLPAGIEAGLYRIAQEAMTNAARHASATRIVVQLRLSEQEVVLAVEDDGRGFEGAVSCREGTPNHGFGIVGMCERVRLLGGIFDVQSTPGVGTRIEVRVPQREAVGA